MESRLYGYDVPRELEEQILLNLPAKSLLRFRSVCKAWNSLISGEKFVKHHLQLQATKPSSSLLLGWARRDPALDKNNNKHVLSLLTIGNSIEEIPLPFSPESSLSSSQYDGIVCLVDRTLLFSEKIVIYNPALREHEFIPTSNDTFVTWGFGHDPKTDDYKFVRLSALGTGLMVSKAEVYTLRTGLWRDIEFNIPDWCVSGHGGTYLKGRLYWRDYCKDKILVWFDMSDESFGTMVLPRVRVFQWPLLVWNGSLVFFGFSGRSFEVWVMDGGEAAGGWSKYCSIGMLAGIGKPIAFWKEDELLMEGLNGSVMSYNLGTEELRKVPVPVSGLSGTFYGSLYTETLVSVKPCGLVNT